MSTLTSLTDLVEVELRDTGNATFSAAELNQALGRAIEEYGNHLPIEKSTTKVTTANSRDITLDATNFPRFLQMVDVEWPTGKYPREIVPFELWELTLTLHTDGLPDGTNARIRWYQRHLVDGSGSTIPTEHEYLVVLGAVAYACLSWAQYAANRLNSDPRATQHYQALGERALADFRKRLDETAGKRALKTRRLATQSPAYDTKTTDWGP